MILFVVFFRVDGLWSDYNDGTWPSCCTGKRFDVKEISTLLGALNTYWPSLSCSSPSNCHGGKGIFWEHEVFASSGPIRKHLAELLCIKILKETEKSFVCWKNTSSAGKDPNFSSYTLFSEKHGTCSSSVTGDEYNYFLTTLNVYFKYNVTFPTLIEHWSFHLMSNIVGLLAMQEVLREAGYVPSNSEKYPLGGIISAIQNAFHATPELECSGDAVEELHLCFYKDFKVRLFCLTYNSVNFDGCTEKLT
ncbi:hypothetical protein RD792_002949 [Penstemon davidsonii]|uniref:Uncharacterized protein n=1 Tax=Penstemon davidsonii TaxID=160366 RepID=A0ABR0DSG0_9LAMI|nr:hypothetical protein RD792_002949 [Penstemon davidsonii]